jgi:hypothetical protein
MLASWEPHWGLALPAKLCDNATPFGYLRGLPLRYHGVPRRGGYGQTGVEPQRSKAHEYPRAFRLHRLSPSAPHIRGTVLG